MTELVLPLRCQWYEEDGKYFLGARGRLGNSVTLGSVVPRDGRYFAAQNARLGNYNTLEEAKDAVESYYRDERWRPTPLQVPRKGGGA